MRSALLWASENQWLKDHLPRYRFVKKAVTRFMPGETLADATTEGRRLQNEGMEMLLTHLGENVNTADEALAVLRDYIGILDEVSRLELRAEPSLKLTHIGLDLGMETVLANMTRLLQHARELNNLVWIDMESSGYVDITLDLYRELRKSYDNVGLCLQSYLRRTEADLESLLPFGPVIRMVKGAYAEPAAIAFPDKKDVDENFYRLCLRMLDVDVVNRGGRIGLGTHDLGLIERILVETDSHETPKKAYEIQMLYGIKSEAQRQITRRGHRMVVLISYGPSWYPWYMRRLAERPANVGFMLKNLVS
jgi:proline dehydrogenase